MPLFVRIPHALKQRLSASASVKNTSISSEVTRVLEEGIHSSFPLEFEQRMSSIRAKLYKMQLESLESIVLSTVANKDEVDATEALNSLGKKVRALQEQRQQAAQDLQREQEKRQLSLACPPERSLGVFAALQPDYAARAPGRLGREEWRRRNLVEVLGARGHGARARLAALIGCTRGYITQLVAEPGAKGHRTITERTARMIEAALELEDGMLDHVPPASDVENLLHAAAELNKVVRNM